MKCFIVIHRYLYRVTKKWTFLQYTILMQLFKIKENEKIHQNILEI